MGRTRAERFLPHVRYGVSALALAAAKHGLRSWLEVGCVVVLEMPFQPPGASASPSSVVRAATAHVPALAEVFRRSPEELAARLARGDRGYLVLADDGRPVHMRWATTRPTLIPEVELWICPAAGEIYVYDAETAADGRGQNHPSAARAMMDADLLAAGFRRKLLYVRADNHAMWHALEAAPGPLRELYRLRYVKVAGRRPWVIGGHGPPLQASADGRPGAAG